MTEHAQQEGSQNASRTILIIDDPCQEDGRSDEEKRRVAQAWLDLQLKLEKLNA